MPLSDPAVTGISPTVIVEMTVRIASMSESFRLIMSGFLSIHFLVAIDARELRKEKNAHDRIVCNSGHAHCEMKKRKCLPLGKEFSFMICAKPVV